MTTPHPLKEIINAIADGIEIEISCKGHPDWIVWNQDMVNPMERRAFYYEYRIKPEPKPDVVVVWLLDERSCPLRVEYGNLKATFDGETGKLKSAEVI